MAAKYTFRMDASEVENLKRALESMGMAGEAALGKLRAAAPSVADAIAKAGDDVDKAREKIAGRSGLAGALETIEGRANRARGVMRDLAGAIDLTGAGSTGAGANVLRFAGTLDNIGDTAATVALTFNALSGKLAGVGSAALALARAHPVVAGLATVATIAGAAFATMGDSTVRTAEQTAILESAQRRLNEVTGESARLDQARTAVIEAEARAIASRRVETERATLAQLQQQQVGVSAGGIGAELGTPGGGADQAALTAAITAQEARVREAEAALRRYNEAVQIIPIAAAAGIGGVTSIEEAFRRLIESIDPATRATRTFAAQQALLRAAVGAGEITWQEYETRLRQVAEIAGATIYPQQQAASATRGMSDAERERQRVMAEGQAVTAANRTALERYSDDVARLTRLLSAGAISQGTFNRALAAADPVARDMERAAEAAQRQIERTAQRTTDRIVDYGANALFDTLTGKASDFWTNFRDFALRSFAQIAADAALRPIVMPIVTAASGWLYGATPAAANSNAAGGGGTAVPSFGGVGSIFNTGVGGVMPGVDAWAFRNLGWGQIPAFQVHNLGASTVAGGTPIGQLAIPGQGIGLLNGGSWSAGFSSISNVLGIAGAALPGIIGGNYVQAGLGVAGAAIGTALLPGVGTMFGSPIGRLRGNLFAKGKTA